MSAPKTFANWDPEDAIAEEWTDWHPGRKLANCDVCRRRVPLEDLTDVECDGTWSLCPSCVRQGGVR